MNQANIFHFIDAYWKLDQIKDEEVKKPLKDLTDAAFEAFTKEAGAKEEERKRLAALGLIGR